MRAIVVEDEFLAAVHAEAVLERLGVEVVGTAEDSAGAGRFSAEHAQLALVDLNLRDGFTGPQVARRLANQGIQVVFVTANPAQLEGINDDDWPVLGKPVEEPELASTLSRLVPRFKQQQGL
jgi:two-component system, response regulator PdtaR